MARGYYCARHDQYYGNIVPCEYCKKEIKDEIVREQMRLVGYEKWKKNQQEPDLHYINKSAKGIA